MTESYPAKLLLFGEYTVLNGSQALAIPLNKWSGGWKQNTPDYISLTAFYQWLADQQFMSPEQFNAIKNDEAEGWHFHSNIPIGYGVGSSGAVVAAVYDHYFPKTTFKTDAQITARIESYFHGTSSGMDPLVSLTKNAIYRDDLGQFNSLENPGWPESFKIFLLDSHQSRHTSPCVEAYKQMMSNENFATKVERELRPYVEHAIHFYLQKESRMLEECIDQISQFQRKHFEKMIPVEIQKAWDELMNTAGVYVKFCGAGGGGFFLVIDSRGSLDSKQLISIQE